MQQQLGNITLKGNDADVKKYADLILKNISKFNPMNRIILVSFEYVYDWGEYANEVDNHSDFIGAYDSIDIAFKNAEDFVEKRFKSAKGWHFIYNRKCIFYQKNDKYGQAEYGHYVKLQIVPLNKSVNE